MKKKKRKKQKKKKKKERNKRKKKRERKTYFRIIMTQLQRYYIAILYIFEMKMRLFIEVLK